MARRVLIVDDNTMNRALLRHTLSKDYDITEAENGEAALSVIRRSYKTLSAVLLDIMMPVMDGYEVLKKMREHPLFAQLPVIVVTGSEEETARVKALELGANDFITKPFNPEIVRHCIRNNIALRETASIVNALQRDKLTGIYNREYFFIKAEELIKSHKPGHYIIACFDVDNFKLINDQYGAVEGDRILKYIGAALKEAFDHVNGICGRISGDNFASLYPNEPEAVRYITEGHASYLPTDVPEALFVSVGRYVVKDRSLPASTLYDRAYIAKQSIKGRYDTHIAYFDDPMLEEIIKEQHIISDMGAAIVNHQFEVWFQPQYNHSTGALIGAEALVRWRHPDKGMIPPGDFIPVFEQNGFIYELDKYVWEETCKRLRKWIDAGRNPLPVSVNISRYDVFKEGLIQTLTGLLDKYELSADLLRLEITESAFAKSAEQIIAVIRKLQEKGFTIEIDDFGSGYSSLNTLKDVPAQIIKLDMRFLEDKENSQRGGNILESIVRMARWLDMSVIAEGVETIEQANFLKSIGCDYVQGYLYARPMPVESYETLARSVVKEQRLIAIEALESYDSNVFWDPKSMDTLIFNSYVGGACIFEYRQGRIELLRVSDKYVQVIGSDCMTSADLLKLRWEEHLEGNSAARFILDLQNSINNKKEVTREYVFLSLPGCPEKTYLRTSLRVIASVSDRYLVYCITENKTALRQAEEKEREVERNRRLLAEQLQAVMDNISGGVSVSTIKDGVVEYIYANDMFYELFGYSRKSYNTYFKGKWNTIHPDEMDEMRAKAEASLKSRQPYSADYRIIRRDGKIRWMRSNVTIMEYPGVDEPVRLAVINDITEQLTAERSVKESASQMQAILHNVNGGVSAATLKDGEIGYIFVNDEYFAMFGYTREQFEAELPRGLVDLINPEDMPLVYAAADENIRTGGATRIVYRACKRDGSEIWVRSSSSVCSIEGVENPVHIAVTVDISEQMETDEQLRFLNDMAHDLLSRADTELAIKNTLTKLIAYFEGTRAVIFEIDFEAGLASNTYEVCAEGVSAEKEKLQAVSTSLFSHWFRAFNMEDYIAIEDVDALEESRTEKQLLKARHIRSMVAVPLRRDGKLFGVMGVQNARQMPTQIDRLVALGDYIAVILTRRDMNAKIKADNETLSELMNDTPGGFIRARVQPNGELKPEYFNAGFCALVGMEEAALKQLYAKSSYTGVHPDDVKIARAALGDLLKNGQANSDAYRLQRGDGSYIYVKFFGRLITHDNGARFVNFYYADATEQHDAEEKQMALLDNQPEGAALFEYNGETLKPIHINKRYWELVGRAGVDCESIDVMGAVYPKDRAVIGQELNAAIRQGRDFSCDIRILKGENEYRPFHVSARIVPRGDGKYSVYAAYIPISNENMSYREMLPFVLSSIMEATSALSFAKDRDFRYICSSLSFARMAGLESENDLIGKTDYDIFEREIADKYRRDDEALLSGEKPIIDMVERIPSKDGVPHYSSTSKYLLRDSNGVIFGLYGVGRDITEDRASETQLALFNDSIPGGIATYLCTPGGYSPEHIKLIYFNDGFCRLFGYTREEYQALSCVNPMSRVYKDDAPMLGEQLERLLNKDVPIDCIYRAYNKNGEMIWIHYRGTAGDRQDETALVNAVLFDVTARQRALEKLRISEEAYRLAVQQTGSSVARYDIAKRTLEVESSNVNSLGITQYREDVPYETVRQGIVSPESEKSYVDFYEEILHGGKNGRGVFQYKLENGWRWLEARYSTVCDDGGKPVFAVVSYMDVTERLEKETVYTKWQQSLREKKPESYTLFRCNLSKDASLDTVEGKLLSVSFDPEMLDFNKRTQCYVREHVYEEDRGAYLALLDAPALIEDYKRGERYKKLEYREVLPEGGVRWLRLAVELVEFSNSTDVEAYLMYENIDETKRAQEKARSSADTDQLTGLLNRKAFAEKMEYLINRQRKNTLSALMVVNLDGYKAVNDSFGYAIGDQTLIETGQTLRSISRKQDLVSKMGGDEFIVFLYDIRDKASVVEKARQICAMTRKSFSRDVMLSSSIGIALCSGDGDSFTTLYHQAEAALYHVKTSGKDNYAFYSEEIGREAAQPRKPAAEGAFISNYQGEERRRMLVVEDNELSREVLINEFKDEFIVESAVDGNEALLQLNRYGAGVSVVLLDLLLPDIDGFDVLERMQENSELRDIPVIVVSAVNERESSLRAVKCGAYDYVTKPFDPDLLRLRVHSAISRAENAQLRAQNRYLEIQSNEIACLRTVLDSDGIVLVEYDVKDGSFRYDDAIGQQLAGSYDERPLWEIFSKDGVAKPEDVQKLRRRIEKATEETKETKNLYIALKKPNGAAHQFCVRILKRRDAQNADGKLVVTFADIERDGDDSSWFMKK